MKLNDSSIETITKLEEIIVYLRKIDKEQKRLISDFRAVWVQFHLWHMRKAMGLIYQ